MINQEKLDLEVILRCAAREIIRPYSLHIEDGELSFEEKFNENYIASDRSTEELKTDLLWLHENLDSNNRFHQKQILLIEAWLRQYEVWRNK